MALLFIGGAIAMRGGALQDWVQHLPAGPLIALFFRPVEMPGGSVLIRRPPAETRRSLSDRILVKPAVANLYRLRAHEDELALDFTAAESDWRKYARLEQDRAEGNTALADYFHRREEAPKELSALQTVAALPTDPVKGLEEQAPWRATKRILTVVDTEGLPSAISVAALDAWLRLHPEDRHGYRTAIELYTAKNQFDRAQTAIEAYAREFPEDLTYPVQQRAALAVKQGDPDRALAIYEKSFQPLWPPELTASWFELLASEQRSSAFVADARRALQGNPTDLNAAARLFDYFLNSHNNDEARRVLAQFGEDRTWNAEGLWTMGQLFERLPDPNEAARHYYALYSLPGATPADAERALAALASLLITAPEQAIVFGSGDFSFYRDIAAMDSSPGFLNGILSLLFNSASPAHEYNAQDQKAVSYFHRAAGARLVDLLAQRFPQATRLPELRAELVQAYAVYSEHEAVVSSGQAYLKAFPKGSGRVQVTLLLGDALASLQRENEEFALYDQLLIELGSQYQHVPLGENAAADAPADNTPSPDTDASGGAVAKNDPRSPGYQQVLDRYLARLSQAKRPMDALRVFRRELDRNPNDPGLYRQFAAYLDHNGLGDQVVQTYRRAIAQFPDRSWYDSLARWYLREKRTGDFERLSREVSSIFSGSALDKYFTRVVDTAAVSASLYLQLNLFAHQKFPEDLVFVHNLLNAYGRLETQDGAAYTALIRTYWYYDDNLKRTYLRDLSAQGRLGGEIEQVRRSTPAAERGDWKQAAADNPAAVLFLAEAEAWRSHFEAAAPAFRALAEASPGDTELTSRGASVYRSLAAFFPDDTQIAVNLSTYTEHARPRNRELLAGIGDIYADRDRLAAARPVWNSLLKIEPGKTDSWLSAATIFWDYYLYDDALRVIGDGRKKFGEPALFAYEAGAIYEGQREYQRALEEYAAGAMHGQMEARSRLLRLAQRKSTAGAVDRVTAALPPGPEQRDLRIAVLETQNRRDDLEAFLNSLLASSQTLTETANVAAVALRDGFADLEERATVQEVALTLDPIEKIRKQIELARFYTSHRDAVKAAQTLDALYRANPKVLGVVRATVEFEKLEGRPDRAIQILLSAARDAHPELASAFTLEAATTASSAGEYAQARSLLAGLLKSDPYRAEYVAAEADTFARARDDAGFEAFTLGTIKSLENSTLSPADRTERIVALRRGLIPVLTREGAFDRATAQYIETLNRYPEDDGLAREAAQYAVAHHRLDQLLAFYRKTIHDAPRDYRWPIVLARVETVAVDYGAAIGAYELAMKDRPDRADLPQARAVLEERLLRFDDAIATYGKLYDLTYHDPQWMEHVAELQARLGHVDEAVKDLRIALIGDRQETPEALLDVAGRLDQWNLPAQALPFAERAQTVSGNQQEIYYRILARTRGWNALFVKDITETGQAAQVVQSQYTPEEKAQVERILANQIDWLPFIQKAKLAPLEARLLLQFVPGDDKLLGDLDALQTRRGLFSELGAEMERLAAMARNDDTRSVEENYAASAYVAEDDRPNALRIISELATREDLPFNLRNWWLAYTGKNDPNGLVSLAGEKFPLSLRDAAARYAIGNGSNAIALRTVAARGMGENPLWTRAFTALTGVYLADPAAAVTMAFKSALNSDATIGARLQAPVNRQEQLAGSLWFYYGARYGEYLVELNRPDAERFLPAALEAAPGNPDAYMQLGGFYENQNRANAAVEQYRSALQLDANRADAHDHIARIFATQGKRAEALQEWRVAIGIFEKLQSRGNAVAEVFWTYGLETIADIGSHGALAELQPDLARWIGDYAQRNGDYRLDPLLTAAFNAALDAHQPADWVLDIAVDYAGDQTFVQFLGNERLTNEMRQKLQRRRLEVIQNRVAAVHGDERLGAERQLAEQRAELVTMLIDAGQPVLAQTEWNQIPEEVRREHMPEQILLAGASGTVTALLQQYASMPDRAPGLQVLLEAVNQLRAHKLESAALSVSEFAYRQELDNQNLDASNFLGLAEVMLARKQSDLAIPLLHRMNLVAGQPFETFVPAADLLRRYKFHAEAVGFLRDRIRAVPWDASAQLQLAGLLNGAERDALLNRVVGDGNAAYDQRAAAAEALAPRGSTAAPAGSELAALARGPLSLADAEQPYRVAARVKAASSANALRLLRDASGIAPENNSVRVLEIRAALTDGRDALAESLASRLNQSGQPDEKMALDKADSALEEDLFKAAERLNDLDTAVSYETAVSQRTGNRIRLEALLREQRRQQSNLTRQPMIGPSIEQKTIVQPRISVADMQRAKPGSTP